MNPADKSVLLIKHCFRVMGTTNTFWAREGVASPVHILRQTATREIVETVYTIP